MSYYVLGIAEEPFGEELAPLSNQTRIPPSARFLAGYLNEIAPAFQEFSERGEDILGLHSFASVSPDQVYRAKDICAQLKKLFSDKPESWRVRLGMIKFPGEAERPFEPLVVRRRALTIIDRIEWLLDAAHDGGGTVVFASGAWYVPLCGIELPPGTVHYS